MSDSCNHGGNGGNDDGGSRRNEWEVVSLSLSSHSLSASTSLHTCTEQGNGGDTFASALNSEYVLCSPKASPEEAGNQSPRNSEDRARIVEPDWDSGEKKTEATAEVLAAAAAAGLTEEALLATKGIEQEEHGRKKDTLLPVARSCASQMQEFSGMDWLEPMIPVDYELDEIGSVLYGLVSDSKSGAEPDFGQGGPLLGSCLSSPSSPTIVSRANSMRLLLGEEEVFQGQIDGGDEMKAPACVNEEEVPVPSLGLEMEISGEDSGCEFPDSGAGVDTQKKTEVVADNIKSPLLGHRCNEQTYEVWWKQQAALWCMQARQVNTLWSIALAAMVMGIVIIGHRWQRECCQNQQLRLQLCSKDEKITQLVFQIARLKDCRRVPVLRTSSSYGSFLNHL